MPKSGILYVPPSHVLYMCLHLVYCAYMIAYAGGAKAFDHSTTCTSQTYEISSELFAGRLCVLGRVHVYGAMGRGQFYWIIILIML